STLLNALALPYLFFFFFNDTAPTDIYTLSLHDALPICLVAASRAALCRRAAAYRLYRHGRRSAGHYRCRSLVRRHGAFRPAVDRDRKSTRLNSSHSQISYAVFCLKKKKKTKKTVKTHTA